MPSPASHGGSPGRAAAGEALARSEERFHLLVDAVIDYAIFMLDPQGRVVSWNAGAQRIKGYAAGEIVGQHFSRFYPPEDAAAGKPARVLAEAARAATSRRRAGASARTAPASGPAWWSPRCGTGRGRCGASPR